MVKQAVKVLIRARPTASFASKNIKLDPATGTIGVSLEKREEGGVVNNQTDSWKFKFDRLLNNATQDEVYEASSQELVSSVVAGYNGTVMCYGQTGSGKTFTMSGSSTEFKYRGVVPRAVAQVYREIATRFDQAVTVRVSYIEIYNEMVSIRASFHSPWWFRCSTCSRRCPHTSSRRGPCRSRRTHEAVWSSRMLAWWSVTRKRRRSIVSLRVSSRGQ
jgi:kinesin family protein 6/9